MHGDVFTQLSLVIVIATVVALIMRAFRQPLIMGHILTGIIVGPAFLHLIEDKSSFETFSEIGIALLLFIIGLELSFAVIRQLGKPVILTASALLFTIGTLGYLVALAFHFTPTEAVITGLALFFSSTIIIAKVLSDKKEATRLNGQIAIGVILLDDIIATFALLYVAAQGGDPLGAADIVLLVAKGLLAVAALAFMGLKVLPIITKHIAKSQELLFLFALAWGFGVASVVNAIGFSVEVGALFAGVALAHLPYAHQIGARLKPLRDFFVILFFISLGENLQMDNLAAGLVPALIISFIVIVLKPITVMSSLGLLGYTKRTSFKTGINLSQISEFSIILVVLAHQNGLVGDKLSAIITLVAIITIAISTYLMKYDNWLFGKFEKSLRLFERTVVSENAHEVKTYPLILLGYKNGGHQFVRAFKTMRQRYVVADYDPEIIEELEHKHIPYLYGDVTDPELLSEINIDKAKLIVSTISEHTINVSIVSHIHRHNKDAVVICYSKDHNDAAELYDLGATYVILPHFIGSEQMSTFIEAHGTDKQAFERYKRKRLLALGEAAIS